MHIILELKNVTVSLTANDRILIKDLSFVLNPGDKAVIIGEEGNGKSTLLKLIYGEAGIAEYCQYTGNIVKSGRFGYLPQAFPDKWLDSSIAEFLEGYEAPVFASVLCGLGLSPDFARSGQIMGTLSGGEKIKLQLARILMAEPDMLLLDEPTNDIDAECARWLENFINNSRLPVLFISHDEMLIENTATRIIHLEQLVRKTESRITIAGCGYAEYIESRKLTFDKQTMVAKKQRSDHSAQMERWNQIYNRVDHEQSVISRGDPAGGRLLKKKMKSVKAQEKRLAKQTDDFIDIPQTETAILTRFDGGITLPPSKVVLDLCLPRLEAGGKILAENIILRVAGNCRVGITGRNGAGKSTLLSVIWDTLKDRRDITACVMPQDYAQVLDYSLTPVEFLAERYTKQEVTQARTFLGSMRFTHEEMTGRIGSLSGGQKAKLLFLDMVIKKADVLVLDEPTRNFSPLSGPVIRKTLKEFGGAIISVSHDRRYLNEVCGIVYELTPEGLVLNKRGDAE